MHAASRFPSTHVSRMPHTNYTGPHANIHLATTERMSTMHSDHPYARTACIRRNYSHAPHAYDATKTGITAPKMTIINAKTSKNIINKSKMNSCVR